MDMFLCVHISNCNVFSNYTVDFFNRQSDYGAWSRHKVLYDLLLFFVNQQLFLRMAISTAFLNHSFFFQIILSITWIASTSTSNSARCSRSRWRGGSGIEGLIQSHSDTTSFFPSQFASIATDIRSDICRSNCIHGTSTDKFYSCS